MKMNLIIANVLEIILEFVVKKFLVVMEMLYLVINATQKEVELVFN